MKDIKELKKDIIKNIEKDFKKYITNITKYFDSIEKFENEDGFKNDIDFFNKKYCHIKKDFTLENKLNKEGHTIKQTYFKFKNGNFDYIKCFKIYYVRIFDKKNKMKYKDFYYKDDGTIDYIIDDNGEKEYINKNIIEN